MKYTKWVAILLCLLQTISSKAQEDSTITKKESGQRLYFSSINNIGLIKGASEKELSLQTVNGVQYGNWFGGIGAGIDYYNLRSIPLFAAIRRSFFSGADKLFAYGDIGVNIPWAQDKDKLEWYKSDYQSGLYYDAGIGAQLQLKNRSALLISAGYSLKAYREDRAVDMACIWGPCPSSKEHFDYDLHRLVIKAGLKF